MKKMLIMLMSWLATYLTFRTMQKGITLSSFMSHLYSIGEAWRCFYFLFSPITFSGVLEESRFFIPPNTLKICLYNMILVLLLSVNRIFYFVIVLSSTVQRG